MKIPLLDLRAQDAVIGQQIRAAVEDVLASQEFVLGVPVAAFEREMADFCGATNAVGVASGTDALYLALSALGIEPGTAVLTSAYSFIATATPIVRLGARPVLVDVDPVTLNMTPEGVLRAIERYRSGPWPERLVAVLPVHLFGRTVALRPIGEIAAAYGLLVIEDAAQAAGAEIPGFGPKRAGAAGDVGCLSFYPTKNLGGLGDGGMVLTSSGEVAQRLRSLRVHGAVGGPYRHEAIGLASRLDALQAAALSVKLRYLDRWNAARRQIAAWYTEGFRATGLVADHAPRPAPTPPRIGLPELAGAAHVFHQYVIRVPGCRNALRAYLDDRGIGTQVYYPIPLPLQPCLRHLGYREGDFPEAERASEETLALPMYPELERTAVETVVASVADFVRAAD